MDWYYDDGGQKGGPVAESQLDELLRSGAIHSETLVWRSGMPDWQPLHLARPGMSPPIPPPGPPLLPPVIGGALGSICAECQRPFPASEMILLNQSWVCGQCKPIFLQRLMEGSAPGGTAVANGLVWRFDRQMVTRSNTPMPDRCVRCNGPAKGYRFKRQLAWHPPAYLLLIFLGPLIYVIVALYIQKKATLHIGLCTTHRAQRIRFLVVAWILGLVGIAALFVAGAKDNVILVFPGFILMLGALVLGILKVPVITAAKMEDDFVWVKGVDKSFLAELPEWNEPR